MTAGDRGPDRTSILDADTLGGELSTTDTAALHQPTGDREALLERYEAIFQTVSPPFAFVWGWSSPMASG